MPMYTQGEVAKWLTRELQKNKVEYYYKYFVENSFPNPKNYGIKFCVFCDVFSIVSL